MTPVLIAVTECSIFAVLDEVESLTAARAGAVAGTEPSDALRVCKLALLALSICPVLIASIKVVNALLTQLDKLKHRKNVLVMTTSNLVNAIGEWRQLPSEGFTII